MSPSANIRIAIDGPAGTGKSTVARLVARQLGLPLLNSGQLYRSVAYLMRQAGLDLLNSDQAARVAASMRVKIEDGLVCQLNDQGMRGRLASDEISAATPIVAQHLGVREAILVIQQAYAKTHGVVMEGRAIGTSVIPDAEYKFYLTCDLEVRARRRQHQGLHETAAQLLERDRLDMERAIAPLQKAADATEIDTTHLVPEETAARIITKVHSGGAHASNAS